MTSKIFLLSFLFVACAFDRSLRELNSVIWDKSLQFEQQALDKIEEAIGYVEGEHKNWGAAERALQDAIELEEKALMTMKHTFMFVAEYLSDYPSYTRYIYSYEDCKELQDKLEMELAFKYNNKFILIGIKVDLSIMKSTEKEQDYENKFNQRLQSVLEFLKGCRERMGVDIILRGFMKDSANFYDFTFSKSYIDKVI
ncbi:hypothetical protein [Borrelia crocidurae]|nr:hypothetical protein [Borrelia crocidurae]